MGKTADGAVWLNEDLLSPFEYWQFWRNTADADVGRFLRIFTELPQVGMKRGPVGWSTVRDGARGASTGSMGWPHALFVGPLCADAFVSPPASPVSSSWGVCFLFWQERIEELEQLKGSAINDAKAILADEVRASRRATHNAHRAPP